MVMTKIRSFFSAASKREAQNVYITLVSQSRKAFFYTDCAVPDTLDGRFEIILLHVFLKLFQLRSEASLPGAAPAAPLNAASPRNARPALPSTELSRLLQECMFDDMDRNLREMGVGDMGVGKRIKVMSRAAFGRLEIYTRIFDNDKAFREALLRNVYRGVEVAPEALQKLFDYTRNYPG